MNELLSTNVHYFLCLIGQYFGHCGYDAIDTVGEAMQTVQYRACTDVNVQCGLLHCNVDTAGGKSGNLKAKLYTQYLSIALNGSHCAIANFDVGKSLNIPCTQKVFFSPNFCHFC